MKLDFYSILKQFTTNKEQFRLIFQNASRPVLTPTTSQVLILDSSFNPPHLGHLSMIRQGAIDINSTGISLSTINCKSVILLFSVQNADKASQEISNYVMRLQMMKAMCDFINEELGLACGIGITDASLFVDKANLVSEWLNNKAIETIFLVGYDTIVRVFDQKYYSVPVQKAMKPFFAKSKMCVFLRKVKTHDLESQRKYVADLQNIYGPNKIHVSKALDDREMEISSSAIRAGIDKNDNQWEKDVIPRVRELLKSKL